MDYKRVPPGVVPKTNNFPYSTSKFSTNPNFWEYSEGARIVNAIVVGAANTGKTTILRKFNELPPQEKYQPTIGVQFLCREYPNQLKLKIWDSPGDDKYSKVCQSYFRTSHLFIFVFDVTDRSSFEYLPRMEEALKAHGKSSMKSVLLIGNKTDLPNRLINFEEAQAFAEKRGYSGYIDLAATNESPSTIQKSIGELMDQHMYNSQPLSNFSEDNYERQVEGELYKSKVKLAKN